MAIQYITMAAFHCMTAKVVYNGGPDAGPRAAMPLDRPEWAAQTVKRGSSNR